jgi:hypothetical protein
VGLAEAVEEPEAVVPRHLHVGEHQVQVAGGGPFEGGLGAGRGGDLVALLGEDGPEDIAHGGVVVDDQDPGGFGGGDRGVHG